MPFLTIQQALDDLRVDVQGSTDAMKLAAAQSNAIQFLNRNVYADQASLDAAVSAGTAGDDPMVVNDDINTAILLIFGHLYAQREAVYIGTGVAVEVPYGARSLLQPYRKCMGV